MDFLISKGSRSISNFYKNTLCYLNAYGFGNIDDLLNMKVYEIRALKNSLDDEEVVERILNLRGLLLKD